MMIKTRCTRVPSKVLNRHKQRYLKPTTAPSRVDIIPLVCELRGATCRSGVPLRTAVVTSSVDSVRPRRAASNATPDECRQIAMIQSEAEDVNRKAAFRLQPIYHCYWWRGSVNTFFYRASRDVPFSFLFYFFAFVCDRYGSGLHIRATMSWLHYCLKTGGEVEGPCIKNFSTVADIFLFSTVKVVTRRRCPTKEFGGMALWSCG